MSNVSDLNKLYESHKRIAMSPLPYDKWLENYQNNQVLAQKNSNKKPTKHKTEPIKKIQKRVYDGPYPDYVVCNGCNENKHKSEFYKDKSKRGHRMTCKSCLSLDYMRKKYETN